MPNYARGAALWAAFFLNVGAVVATYAVNGHASARNVWVLFGGGLGAMASGALTWTIRHPVRSTYRPAAVRGLGHLFFVSPLLVPCLVSVAVVAATLEPPPANAAVCAALVLALVLNSILLYIAMRRPTLA